MGGGSTGQFDITAAGRDATLTASGLFLALICLSGRLTNDKHHTLVSALGGQPGGQTG